MTTRSGRPARRIPAAQVPKRMPATGYSLGKPDKPTAMAAWQEISRGAARPGEERFEVLYYSDSLLLTPAAQALLRRQECVNMPPGRIIAPHRDQHRDAAITKNPYDFRY